MARLDGVRLRFARGAAMAVIALALGCSPGCSSQGPTVGSGDAFTSDREHLQQDSETGEKTETPRGVPADAVVSVDGLHDLLEEDKPLVVDIRPLYAFDAGAIIGAISIPAGSQFEVRYEEIPLDVPVYLIDADGSRVAEARDYLIEQGYDSANILVVEGGMNAWKAAGYGMRESEIHRC